MQSACVAKCMSCKVQEISVGTVEHRRQQTCKNVQPTRPRDAEISSTNPTKWLFSIKTRPLLCLKWWNNMYFVNIRVKNLSFVGVICVNCYFFVGCFGEIIENSEVGSQKQTNFLHVCNCHWHIDNVYTDTNK